MMDLKKRISNTTPKLLSSLSGFHTFNPQFLLVHIFCTLNFDNFNFKCQYICCYTALKKFLIEMGIEISSGHRMYSFAGVPNYLLINLVTRSNLYDIFCLRCLN